MIPLIPTLAFAFVSFICSAFVILRTVIPILPPSVRLILCQCLHYAEILHLTALEQTGPSCKQIQLN